MKRIIALLCVVLLLCTSVLAEGEAAAETAAAEGPVMLPGVTPALAMIAGAAIAVSIFGWWSNRNDKDRRL